MKKLIFLSLLAVILYSDNAQASPHQQYLVVSEREITKEELSNALDTKIAHDDAQQLKDSELGKISPASGGEEYNFIQAYIK